MDYNQSIARNMVYIRFLLILRTICYGFHVKRVGNPMLPLLKSPILPSKGKRRYWFPSDFIGRVSISVFNVFCVKVWLCLFTLLSSHFMLFGGSKVKTTCGLVLYKFLASVLRDSLSVERYFRLLISLQVFPTYRSHVTTHTLL